MKAPTLIVSAVIAVCLILAGPVAPAPAAAELAPFQEILRLKLEISTINLLNGLYLSKEQTTGLLRLAREAQNAREEYTTGSGELMGAVREAEAAFKALRAEIQKGAPARGEIPQHASRINNRLKELQDRSNQELSARFKALEEDLGRVLTPEQLQVVNDFKPCLIPPKDLNNPVRAGQASDSPGVVRLLQRLRAIPEKRWTARRDRVVARFVEKFNQHHYKMTPEEKKAETDRILALIDRARRMSDVDFEMEKENLAEELRPRNVLDDLRAEIEARQPYQRRPRMSKTGRFLLSPIIIPILEERLAAGRAAQ